MTLYHFCADKHVKKIMREGLTIGGLAEPTVTGYILHNNYIWLTKDPDPKNQSWATRHIVKYSRTAWRLTIEIPTAFARIWLLNRFDITMMYPACAGLLDGWPGSENWRVYNGVIPKEWIVKAERMED